MRIRTLPSEQAQIDWVDLGWNIIGSEPAQDQDEGEALEETGEVLRIGRVRRPPAEGGDGVLCGEAEDGVHRAGSRSEPATQGTSVQGVGVQRDDGGVTPFASIEDFYTAGRGMESNRTVSLQTALLLKVEPTLTPKEPRRRQQSPPSSGGAYAH